MKTPLFFAAAAIAALTTCSLQKANAQNTSPYWSLAGNSNATGSSKLGTTNGIPLRLVTNNFERMRISTTGNIGIGTTAPGYLLDVAGRMRIRTGAETAGAWFMNAANTVNSAFVGMLNDNTVGFYGSSGSGWGLTMNTATANVGIGTTTPVTRLEVSRIDGNFLLARFTNASTSGDRTSLVDIKNGDGVIWRYGAGGTGNSFGITNGQFYLERVGAGPLLTVTANGSVGIGTTAPVARFEVSSSGGANYLARFINTSTTGDRTALVDIQNGNGVVWRTGVGGTNNGLGLTNGQYYLERVGAGALLTMTTAGLVGIGTTSPVYTLDVRTASAFTAMRSFTSVASGNGLIGESNNGTAPYGVEGICSNTTSGFAGYFVGNLHYTGVLSGPSDLKLKENIKPIEKVLDKIMMLKPSDFTFKSAYRKMNLPQGEQIGFIAQEMEKVFPQLVRTVTDKDPDGEKMFEYKGINYIGLIPLLTKAIQEQQEEINELRQTLNQLSQGKTFTENNASLKTTNVFVGNHASLDQNAPNPFINTTSINYNLPPTFKSAQIIIIDANGRTIKQVQLNTAGMGMVNIDAYNLSNGTYSYSLIVDGKLIDSKKMVIGK